MPSPLLIGGALVVILIIIGVIVMFAMGGDSASTTSASTTPASTTPAPITTPPPPPPPKYRTFPDYDFTGGDIACEGGVEASACEAKCDADDKCVSYIHTANDKICCTKYGTPNYTELPGRQITGFIKNVDGYDVKEVGDRVNGDIGAAVNVNLPQCKAKCDSLNNCVGFSYHNNTCYAKQADGLSPTYVNNTYQFYTKK